MGDIEQSHAVNGDDLGAPWGQRGTSGVSQGVKGDIKGVLGGKGGRLKCSMG